MPTPVLRIAVMSAVPRSLPSAAIQKVRQRWPGLVVASTPVWADRESLARVRSGEVDVALLVGPVASAGLVVEDVATLPTRAFVGPHHPLATSNRIDLATLLDQSTFRRPERVIEPWRRFWLLSEHRGGDEPRYLDVAAADEAGAVMAVGSTRAVGFAPAGWAAGSGLTSLVVAGTPAAPIQLARGEHPARGWVEQFCAVLRSHGRRPRMRLPVAESRVAALAASGHSNREIGRKLVVSPRTVETQLASALRRLGLRNRTELAAAWPDLDDDVR